jgi:uncharacterized protein YbjT (DUF2867 family)
MSERMRIAVAGATGRVGRHAVDLLEAAGHEVVPISRSHGVDVVTGDGLARALEGVEAVIDAATGPSPDQRAAMEFFTAAARNLQELGGRAGVRRMAVVSIIGADRFAGGYIAAKVVHEGAHAAGPVPVHILRAAQFHEFVPLLVEWGTRDGVTHLPNMLTQLVGARTVAEALADVVTGPQEAFATGSSAAPVAEIAGPRQERLVDVARLLAARSGDPLRIETASDPADPDRDLIEHGGLLPGPGAVLAGPTFEEWLRAEVPAGEAADALR